MTWTDGMKLLRYDVQVRWGSGVSAPATLNTQNMYLTMHHHPSRLNSAIVLRLEPPSLIVTDLPYVHSSVML